MILRKGSKVLLLTPDNPRLNGATAIVDTVTDWGAIVKTKAAGTGEFRALDSEMLPEGEGLKLATISASAKVNGKIGPKQLGYTGDCCNVCGSSRMRRNGACLVCDDCGSSGGCG